MVFMFVTAQLFSDQLIDLKPAALGAHLEEISVKVWQKMHRGCRENKKLGKKREALRQ